MDNIECIRNEDDVRYYYTLSLQTTPDGENRVVRKRISQRLAKDLTDNKIRCSSPKTSSHRNVHRLRKNLKFLLRDISKTRIQNIGDIEALQTQLVELTRQLNETRANLQESQVQLQTSIEERNRQVQELQQTIERERVQCLQNIRNAVDNEQKVSRDMEKRLTSQINELNRKIELCNDLQEKHLQLVEDQTELQSILEERERISKEQLQQINGLTNTINVKGLESDELKRFNRELQSKLLVLQEQYNNQLREFQLLQGVQQKTLQQLNVSEETINQLTNEREELKGELSTLQTVYQETLEQVDSLKEKYNNELSILTSQVQELQTTLQSRSVDLESTREELKELETEYLSQKRQSIKDIEELSKEYKRVKSEGVVKESQMSGLKEDLKNKELELEEVKETLKNIRSQLKISEENVDKYSVLQDECKTMKNGLERELQSSLEKINGLVYELGQKASSEEGLKKDLGRIQKNFDTVRDKLSKYSRKLKDMKGESVKMMKKHTQELQKKDSSHVKEIELLKTEFALSKEQFNQRAVELNNQIQSLSDQLSISERNHKQKVSELEELQLETLSQKRQTMSDIAGLEKMMKFERDKNGQKIKELTYKLASREDELVRINGTLKDITDELTESQVQVEQYARLQKECNTAQIGLREELREQSERMNKTIQELDDEKLSRVSLENSKRQIEAKLKTITEKFKEMSFKVIEYNKEYSELQSKYTSLEEKHESETGRLNNMIAKMVSIQRVLEGEKQTLEKELEVRDKQLSELQTNLVEMKQEIETSKSENKELIGKLNRLEDKHSELQSEMKRLKEENIELSLNIKNLTEELNEIVEELRKQKSENVQSGELYKELQEAYNEIKSERDVFIKEKERIQNLLDKAAERMVEMNIEMKEMAERYMETKVEFEKEREEMKSQMDVVTHNLEVVKEELSKQKELYVRQKDTFMNNMERILEDERIKITEREEKKYMTEIQRMNEKIKESEEEEKRLQRLNEEMVRLQQKLKEDNALTKKEMNRLIKAGHYLGEKHKTLIGHIKRIQERSEKDKEEWMNKLQKFTEQKNEIQAKLSAENELSREENKKLKKRLEETEMMLGQAKLKVAENEYKLEEIERTKKQNKNFEKPISHEMLV